ncbi:MAG TPA: CBS domain-containing protein [Opitutaceae bacterium]|nr:CBS domain-containing protein [Opitutaceae bacterium]
MKIKDIMTPKARCVAPATTLADAARLMREIDVGALPVCDNDRLSGMVTDRDIVVRGVAEKVDPATTEVRAVMTPGVSYVFEDQEVAEAARIMEERQIRRLPVLNSDKRLVGIVALGDMATEAGTELSGEALREISEPPPQSI